MKKNSSIGTKSTGTKLDLLTPLTAKEAAFIIKVCNQSCVREIAYRGLKVSFHGGRPGWDQESPLKTASAVAAADTIDKETTDREAIVSKETLAAELLVTDPGAYERLFESGEFTDDSRGPNDELEDDGDPE